MDETSSLITAAGRGDLDFVKLLLRCNADIEFRGTVQDISNDICAFDRGFKVLYRYGDFQNGTALYAAAAGGYLDVVSCLVENGADVNARSNIEMTPLMIASCRHLQHPPSEADMHKRCNSNAINLVRYLVEHGANMDLQDKQGNTALHYAVMGNKIEIVKELVGLGASQLHNNQRLTPLLLAGNRGKSEPVEYLITRPECTKEQKIEALELLGASIALSSCIGDAVVVERGFYYMKRGMQERFEDASHPLLKQVMEPIEAYQSRKESETLEELASIEGDTDAIIMEGLIIRERILTPDKQTLIVEPFSMVIRFFHCRAWTWQLGLNNWQLEGVDGLHHFDLCIGLCLHAMEIKQHSNQPIEDDLQFLMNVFSDMFTRKKLIPREKVIVEMFEKTICAYKREGDKQNDENLLYHSMFLLKLFSDIKLREREEDPQFLLHLRKFLSLNPKDCCGNTMLHLVTSPGDILDTIRFFSKYNWDLASFLDFPCASAVKFILSSKADVNAVNDDGNTALHVAATFKPRAEDLHRLTVMLEVLLEKGAHHDFVNNEGKTAMDLAETDEAHRILLDKSRLELTCITARAVKKFGLPYLGVVPKILEEFIERH